MPPMMPAIADLYESKTMPFNPCLTHLVLEVIRCGGCHQALLPLATLPQRDRHPLN